MTARSSSLARAVGLAAALLAQVGTADADNFQVIPRLAVDETFTDNVRLSKTDHADDFITTVIPGISVRGRSARLKTDIDYSMQRRYFLDTTAFNQNTHLLQANTEASLVKDWLYFDVDGRSSVQNTQARNYSGRENRGDSSNLSEVLSYELAPRIQHTYGDWGSVRLGYAHQSIDRSRFGNSPSTLPVGFDFRDLSSVEDSYNLTLKSGGVTGRFPLGLNGQSRTTDFGNGRSSKFNKFGVDAGYQLSHEFELTSEGGFESDHYFSRNGPQSGAFWRVGGRWTPSARTTVSVNWGQRYFGDSVDIKIKHEHRRWHFDFLYDEDVRTINQFERSLKLVPQLDANGQPIFDPITNSEVFIPTGSPTLTDSVYVEKRFIGGLGYTMMRTTLNVRFFQFDRQQQSIDRREKSRGATLSLRHTIRPRLSTSLSFSWHSIQTSLRDSAGTYYTIYPSMEYEIGPHTTLRLQYSYSVNDGGTGGDFGLNPAQANFTENAISAFVAFHL